jgi:hypothetical protein
LPQKLEFVNGDYDKQEGVSHTVALPFTLNPILKAKEELWKLKYFHHAINIIFKKIL